MCTGIIITWTDLHRSRGMRGRKLSGHSLGPNRAECNRQNPLSGTELRLLAIYPKDRPAAYPLQGLRFGVEMSGRFWKIQKECRTEPALPVAGPPIPHAFVFFPDLLQHDLIARERL